MSLQQTERETYEGMWGFEPYASHSPGERYAETFMDMIGLDKGYLNTVLDAGCGSGKGTVALAGKGFSVRMCDLTDAGLVSEAKAFPFREACLWNPLHVQLGYLGLGNAVDYVYCCDVLEHIPPAFTMLVAARLLEVCRIAAFFSVALHPDNFGAFIGKPLHQTVEGFVWWRDALRELGTMVECRDLGANALYLVAPR